MEPAGTEIIEKVVKFHMAVVEIIIMAAKTINMVASITSIKTTTKAEAMDGAVATATEVITRWVAMLAGTGRTATTRAPSRPVTVPMEATITRNASVHTATRIRRTTGQVSRTLPISLRMATGVPGTTKCSARAS